MPPERRHDDPTVASVRTALEFVVKSVDRLDDSVVRLQQTVREDFATIDEVDVVKSGVQQLREDLARLTTRVNNLERGGGEDRPLSPTEVKISRWFLWVAIPAGALALLTLAWEIYSALVKKAVGGP